MSRLLPVCLIALMFCSSAHALKEVESRILIAAIAVKLTQFIQWPKTQNNDAPLQLCLLGENSYGDVFNDTLPNYPFIHSRINHYANVSLVDDQCDILFIDRSEEKILAHIVGHLDNRPILTISEIQNFDTQGGMIYLSIIGGLVTINLNIETTKKAGLKIDTPLLNISNIKAR